MSEKGQGNSSDDGTGTGVGIDETPAGAGGSAADQSGPHEGDTQTRGRGEWSYDDPDLANLEASDAPPPIVDDAGEVTEPAFPGGGPTDTRSGWDHPSGEGPRGDPPEWQGPLPPDKPAGEVKEKSNRPKRKRAPKPPAEATTIDPPNLHSTPDPNASPTDRPPGLSDEQFEQWKKDHPTGLDKANTQTDVV